MLFRSMSAALGLSISTDITFESVSADLSPVSHAVRGSVVNKSIPTKSYLRRTTSSIDFSSSRASSSQQSAAGPIGLLRKAFDPSSSFYINNATTSTMSTNSTTRNVKVHQRSISSSDGTPHLTRHLSKKSMSA